MNQRPLLLSSFCCVALRSSFSNSIGQNTSRINFILSICVCIVFCSCGNTNENVEQPLPSNSSSVFYPVHEYFVMQLLHADTAKNINYYYKDSDNKVDSSIIDSVQFNRLATPFLQDDINDTAIKKYYKESIFNDATTSSNTFTYTSVNKDLPIQTLDILLDTASDNIKNVFITKNFTKGDTAISEKLSWKTNQSFTIYRTTLIADKETTQQFNISWNSNQ